MMTCDAVVNQNPRLTSSETTSELLWGAIFFSTEIFEMYHFFRIVFLHLQQSAQDSFLASATIRTHLQVQNIDKNGSGGLFMPLHHMLDIA